MLFLEDYNVVSVGKYCCWKLIPKSGYAWEKVLSEMSLRSFAHILRWTPDSSRVGTANPAFF